MNELLLRDLKETIGGVFGRNKTHEVLRLLHEISRREHVLPNDILIDGLKTVTIQGNFSVETALKQVPFAQLKRYLVRRRFPHFSSEDLKKLYFAPLREMNDETPLKRTDQARFQPKLIAIDRAVHNSGLAEKARDLWPDAEFITIDSLQELKRPKKTWLSDFGKRNLVITHEQYDLVKPCPCSAQTCSCNYYVLNTGYGCPYDCSYCYLQEYQNLPAIIIPASLDPFLKTVDEMLASRKSFFTRIGTGEYADSLALDWFTEQSKTLIPFFKDKPVILELKTKSACVDNLLNLEHGGKTVIAWSVNPSRFSEEEKGTALIEERLKAAAKCERAGYGTAFHFDPILQVSDWEKDYRELVNQIFDHVGKSIRWISLGTLRFYRDLREIAEFRHPSSEIFLGEMRLEDADQKMRYSIDYRVGVYRRMVEWIRERHKEVPVYLCMETPEVWRQAFEQKPYAGRIDEWIAPNR